MDWIKEHRFFTAVFAALVALFLAPLFMATFLPFPDFPNHAAELMVVSHYSAPDYQFERYWDLSGWLHPYMAHRIPLVPLAWWLGAERAYRVFIGLYLVAAPVATLAHVARGGRSPWLALFIFPVLYSYPFIFGFGTYTVGTAALLLALLQVECWLDAPSRPHLVLLGTLLLVVFLFHPQPFLYALVFTPLLVVLSCLRRQERPWQRLGDLALALLPGAVLLTLYVLGTWTDVSYQEFFPLRVRFNAFPMYAAGYWLNEDVYEIFYVFGGLLVVARLAPRPAELSTRWADTVWEQRYLVMVALCMAGSVVFPEVYGFQHYVASRLVPMALLLAPLVLRDAPVWHGKWLPTLAVGASAALGLTVLGEFAVFNHASASFQKVIDVIPTAARYRCFLHHAPSSVLHLSEYDGFCGYVALQKGGYFAPIWETNGIHFRQEWDHTAELDTPDTFRLDLHGDLYDYFVTTTHGPQQPFAPGGPLSSQVELVAEADHWRVYRRTGSVQRPPPAAATTAARPL